MSEAQVATVEQQERMQKAIAEAQQKAYQDMQQNAQLEIQMRMNALSAAVNANTPGTDPEVISQAASTFIKFLKQGEATNG
jgi:deferrochelatase/peroxidase EfeB